MILETLHWCSVVETSGGLECGTIPICVDLLGHQSPRIRGQAARLIFDLTVPLGGKKIAYSTENCLTRLVGLLDDQCSFVRAQVAAALMR